MSSGRLSRNWYLIRMSYDKVIMSSRWHRLPFLSHPDGIANFDFPHHAVALQRFRTLHISWRSTHLLHLYFLFSWWRHQMEPCSASLAFVRGIHRWLRGIHRSPVNSPHTDQWRGALMFSLICAWTNGWVNNQDAGDLIRHRAHCDVTVMWCRIVIQWSGQPWDLSTFNASLLSNFELVKRVKLGGSVHYGRNGLKFGTLLHPDYHSLKLTIFFTQRQLKFEVSDHP